MSSHTHFTSMELVISCSSILFDRHCSLKTMSLYKDLFLYIKLPKGHKVNQHFSDTDLNTPLLHGGTVINLTLKFCSLMI